jgi:Transposase, Mutator family
MGHIHKVKYERAVHQCHNELGISKSVVSRQHIKELARALGALRERHHGKLDIVAVFMGRLDLNKPRRWVIDGSKALASAIDSLCGEAAKVQRWQIHKIRNVTERLPKAMQEQVAWRIKALAQERKAQHPDAAGQRAMGPGADVHCGHAGRARGSGMQFEQHQHHRVAPLGGASPQPAGDKLSECRHGATLDSDGLLGNRARHAPHLGLCPTARADPCTASPARATSDGIMIFTYQLKPSTEFGTLPTRLNKFILSIVELCCPIWPMVIFIDFLSASGHIP